MSDAWIAFRDFVERTEDLPVGFLVRGACKRDPGDEVIAAYDAPFPSAASKAGARAFPLMLPTTPDAPGRRSRPAVLEAPARRRAAQARPVGRLRPGAPARDRAAVRRRRWEPRSTTSSRTPSHFLQEDAGAEIGGLIADWLHLPPTAPQPPAGPRAGRLPPPRNEALYMVLLPQGGAEAQAVCFSRSASAASSASAGVIVSTIRAS